MEYRLFKSLLNKQIFESSKRDLLEKIAKYPERYIGLFRPSKPKTKIFQNLLQSNEIRFGDALEIIFDKYFEQHGFTSLPKKIKTGKEYLNLDQLFKDENHIYFIEQKVRDDHDSTKKRGQIGNFEKKIITLLNNYDKTKLRCYTYFIDPSLIKNKKYYTEEIIRIQTEHKVKVKLCYGKELWDDINRPEIWNELLKHLKQWKNEIPEMPSINFDDDPQGTFEEIKNIKVQVLQKLFSNQDLCSEILPLIFPKNDSLILLQNYYHQQKEEHRTYITLLNKISEYINSRS